MEMDVIMIRLDRYLADMSIGTRTEVKKLIRQGKVAVDGLIVKNPDIKVDIDTQNVTCNGIAVTYETYEYYMLNKPAGVISATSDKTEKTVLDLMLPTMATLWLKKVIWYLYLIPIPRL